MEIYIKRIETLGQSSNDQVSRTDYFLEEMKVHLEVPIKENLILEGGDFFSYNSCFSEVM